MRLNFSALRKIRLMSGKSRDDPGLHECAVSAALIQPDLWTSNVSDPNRWVSLLDSAARRRSDFLRETDATSVTARLFETWKQGAPLKIETLETIEKAGRL
jgi:hypothetical protein